MFTNPFRGLAPTYVSELLTPYSIASPVRSSNCSMLAVPRSFKKRAGDMGFYSVAATRLCQRPLRQPADAFKTHTKIQFSSLDLNCIKPVFIYSINHRWCIKWDFNILSVAPTSYLDCCTHFFSTHYSFKVM